MLLCGRNEVQYTSDFITNVKRMSNIGKFENYIFTQQKLADEKVTYQVEIM